MLLSMTGFGEAHCQRDGVAATVEVRTINSKHFKLSYRYPEGYASLEPRIEQQVREPIKRGTISVSLQIRRPAAAESFRLNSEVLAGYRRQLSELKQHWPDAVMPSLAELLPLPGVVDELGKRDETADRDWPLVSEALRDALAMMGKMRVEEGRVMAADLKANVDLIAGELLQIEQRAPLVVEGYRGRLFDRVQALLEEYRVTLQPEALIREVSIFAERCDIAEEVVRLKSHIEQFYELLSASDSPGRRLEFLTQEMFREMNTIGSKCSDVSISRHAIEMKAAVERVREMIQNVE